MIQEEWQDVRHERRAAAAERQRLEMHICERVPDQPEAQSLLSAWKQEMAGWQCVECELDSGAADSVCPKSMAPWFAVEDSEASKAGVYYTAANGGRFLIWDNSTFRLPWRMVLALWPPFRLQKCRDLL